MTDSEIKNFYQDQTIFITGGTGFLGKLLIEKLLRTCDVRKIYALVRPKKDKTIQERITTFFEYPCFDRLKKEKPNFEKLMTFVDGNCEKINLGLNSEFERMLMEETNVVIHTAANVKFEQTLREAANINVRSTRDILKLSKKMPLLKAFVYVSTAYSNCPRHHIREEFYDPPLSAEQMINILNRMDDELLVKITPKMITPWPNTYTFTKSIAEDLIKTEGKKLPVAVIRPAIVTTTLEEPMPGWIDNFYGVVGVVFGASLGIIRSLNAKKDNISNIVPCDYVANIVLASAWNIPKEKQKGIRIYNFVCSKTNSLTWRNFMKMTEECGWDYPPEKIVWHYTFKLRENTLWHKICIFFQHTVLAYVADFILICLWRQPMAVKNYDRLNKMLSLISYFTMNNWIFDDNNVDHLWRNMKNSDRNLFAFNMKTIDWKSFLRSSVIGMRVYLLKEPLETIPQGEKKVRIMAIVHYFLLTIFYLMLLSFLWCIFRLFF